MLQGRMRSSKAPRWTVTDTHKDSLDRWGRTYLPMTQKQRQYTRKLQQQVWLGWSRGRHNFNSTSAGAGAWAGGTDEGRLLGGIRPILAVRAKKAAVT